MVGGYTSDSILTFEIFNTVTKIWTKMPNMIDTMHTHSCGMAQATNGKELVAVKNTKVNIFDFQSGEWVSGQPLEYAVSGVAPMVPYGKGLLIVDGVTGIIQKYDSDSRTWTMLKNTKLKSARQPLNAVLVSKDTVTCNKSF
jgi:hypothetical protein